MSYSRHAVDDRDLSTQVIFALHNCLINTQALIAPLFFIFFLIKVNYRMRMNIRRMAQGDRKHHKRSKRLNKVKWILSLLINVLIYNLFILISGRIETESRFIPRIPAKRFSKTTCEWYEISKTLF